MSDPFLPHRFPVENPEELAAQETARIALADAVRRLVDLTIRTTVSNDEAYAVAAGVAALADRLEVATVPGPLGLELGSDGRFRNEANPVVGRRNAAAPPLEVHHDDGFTWAEVTLGAPYEGPPGKVHGGITAAILDQVMGSVAAWANRPGMTAYLNLTYRRPTPLGQLRCEARLAEATGRKTRVTGEILDAQGRVTVEADALFVVPQRWLDRLSSQPEGDSTDVPTDQPA